jgi:hypothetical protein
MPPEPDPLHEASPSGFRYTNYFEVGFNLHEVIIDCGLYFPGDTAPSIHTRLITTPVYVQSLVELLQDTMRQRRRALEEPE